MQKGPLIGRVEALERFPWLESAHWRAADDLFPVRVPRGYVGDATTPDDPRLLTSLPQEQELRPDADDRPDPVGDRARSPLPWVVRKHADRVLLLLTKRCHLYCRYCFRRDHHPTGREDPTDEEWEAMLDYAVRSGAREAILSGGDPLAISDARLFAAMDRLRPAIPVLRIHTRAPITWPQRITPALVAGLAARKPVWVLVHANHPVELSPPVRAALGQLVDAGVPVLNQAVLLAGVNDDPQVLAALCEELVGLRVFPYYLHHPDHAPGNAAFRVTPEVGLEIYQALRRRVSGVALPTYVMDLPDGSGKIPVETWLQTAQSR